MVLVVCATVFASAVPSRQARAAEELLPKHINPQTMKAVKSGLDYLARTQNQDGYWNGSQDGRQYPVTMASLAGMAFLANGNTPTRGPYAENVRKTVNYILTNVQPSGLITSQVEFNGRSMYSHGFSMMFLASVYGMENDERARARIKTAVNGAIKLTSEAQSNLGGWTYVPGGGDEGSVTVTQLQGLRAAQNAGFLVPKATIENAIKYLERCKTPEGGIRYSANSGPQTMLAISAAGTAGLYNAGQYDSDLAKACLDYVSKRFAQQKNQWSKGGGHDFYTHLYASQSFYQSGDKLWDDYFPQARDQMLGLQNQSAGSWEGDGIGPVYGTSIALTILQLPFKFLPIYQR